MQKLLMFFSWKDFYYLLLLVQLQLVVKLRSFFLLLMYVNYFSILLNGLAMNYTDRV